MRAGVVNGQADFRQGHEGAKRSSQVKQVVATVVVVTVVVVHVRQSWLAPLVASVHRMYGTS